jgi:hypothetical protein
MCEKSDATCDKLAGRNDDDPLRKSRRRTERLLSAKKRTASSRQLRKMTTGTADDELFAKSAAQLDEQKQNILAMKSDPGQRCL